MEGAERVAVSMAEAIRALFRPEPGTIYLDTTSYGLPPEQTVQTMTRAMADWQSGRADWKEDWDAEGDICRSRFAELIPAQAEDIALVPTVSVGVATGAASLAPAAEVIVPFEEFTSVLFPLRVAALYLLGSRLMRHGVNHTLARRIQLHLDDLGLIFPVARPEAPSGSTDWGDVNCHVPSVEIG